MITGNVVTDISTRTRVNGTGCTTDSIIQPLKVAAIETNNINAEALAVLNLLISTTQLLSYQF
jgi:hypothetical protein